MAACRGRSRARGDIQSEILTLGKTRTDGGIDTRFVHLEALPFGRYAVSLWRGNDHRLLISDTVAPGSVAMIANHVLAAHQPFHLDTLEVSVCDVETCAQARAWAAVQPPTAAVAGS